MAKNILVVDDEPDILEVIKRRVEKMGFGFLGALDGKEALKVIQSKRPDLIILDLNLPIVSEHEISKKIKSNGVLKNIPIIILTASTQNIENKTKELKADGYLLKPFDNIDFEKTIKTAFEK